MKEKIKTKKEFLKELSHSNGEATEKTKKSIKNVKEEEEGVTYTSYYEDDTCVLEQIGIATDATHATHAPRSKKYKFILFNKLDGTTEEIDEFRTDNKVIRPIINDILEKGAVKLPGGIEEYGTTAELIKEIKEYLLTYFQPPKFYENFLPYYVLFTWVYENFPFIAYLHFTGLTGTGKTIAAETIANICYKPVDAAGSVTIASIFRLADQWGGTLFLDEFDLSSFGKEGYHAVVTFLKTGVSDRAVLRVEGEKKKEIQSFCVKSPKIFTSENPVTDAGLQSRTFLIKMEKNSRKLPLYKLNTYYEKAEKLRNKLLLFRLRNMNKIDLSKVEFGFPELNKLDGRVQQIITPLYYLSDEDTRKEIVEFAKQQEAETFRERIESLEGQLFMLIADRHPNTITLSELHEAVNADRKSFLISEKKIANVIRKKLNFDIERIGHENISTLIISDERVEVLKEYYGLRGGQVASVADVASVAENEIIEAETPIALAEKIFEIQN